MHQQTRNELVTRSILTPMSTYFTFPSLPYLWQILKRSQDHAEYTKHASPIVGLPMLRRTSNSSKQDDSDKERDGEMTSTNSSNDKGSFPLFGHGMYLCWEVWCWYGSIFLGKIDQEQDKPICQLWDTKLHGGTMHPSSRSITQQ